jgi:hypothetical protein
VVVDQNDAEVSAIILRQERGDRLRDAVGLVARGDEADDGGARARRARRQGARHPKEPAQQQQIEPRRERRRTKQHHRRAHRHMPWARNQAIASAMPSLADRAV